MHDLSLPDIIGNNNCSMRRQESLKCRTLIGQFSARNYGYTVYVYDAFQVRAQIHYIRSIGYTINILIIIMSFI